MSVVPAPETKDDAGSPPTVLARIGESMSDLGALPRSLPAVCLDAVRRGLRRITERQDRREFLSAALEIIDKPQSPASVAMLYAVVGIVVCAVAWSVFSMTDVVAIANGKVQPSDRVKVIQPLEAGLVREIRVQNGSKVRAGDVLVEFESDDASSDVTSLSEALLASQGEVARRSQALEAARKGSLSAPDLRWPEGMSQSEQVREATVLMADLEQFSQQLSANQAQANQKAAERAKLLQMIKAQNDLVDVLRERVDMRSGLAKTGASTRASVIDAKESLAYHQTTLASQKGQLLELDEAVKALASERDKIISVFIADQSNRRLEAQKSIDDLTQKLSKARMRLTRKVLKSPVDGVVQSLSLSTIGQVVGPGESIMKIVPVGTPLELELFLPNRDVGFVREGQRATVKLDAFPYTQFGTIGGTVTRVGRDSVLEQDAWQGDQAGARSTRDAGGASSQRGGQLVFPVTVTLDNDSIALGDRSVQLTSGMAATAEIKIRRRRIIDFLLSPLRETTGEAFREI